MPIGWLLLLKSPDDPNHIGTMLIGNLQLKQCAARAGKMTESPLIDIFFNKPCNLRIRRPLTAEAKQFVQFCVYCQRGMVLKSAIY